MYRRRASMVPPGIGGSPPVMIRRGSPAAWQSIVWRTRAYRMPDPFASGAGFPAGTRRKGDTDPTAKHTGHDEAVSHPPGGCGVASRFRGGDPSPPAAGRTSLRPRRPGLAGRRGGVAAVAPPPLVDRSRSRRARRVVSLRLRRADDHSGRPIPARPRRQVDPPVDDERRSHLRRRAQGGPSDSATPRAGAAVLSGAGLHFHGTSPRMSLWISGP